MGDSAIRHRLSLWLRSERAFGVKSVQAPPVPIAPPPPDRPMAATAHSDPDPMSNNLFGISEAPKTAMPPSISLPVLPRATTISQLSAMDQNQVKGCTKCALSQKRTNTVFGEGDPDASIFFVGEGPGENEDLQGRPFVGRAGELLNKMIAGMGLKREQVFIANIVKCRPPGNREPAPDEVATCTPYLVRQLEIVRPKVIVTLGRPSSQYMLETKQAMSKMRGQWHNWRGIKLMPTFHPAYLLRAYTPENRALVWSDLQKVMAEVGLPLPKKPVA